MTNTISFISSLKLPGSRAFFRVITQRPLFLGRVTDTVTQEGNAWMERSGQNLLGLYENFQSSIRVNDEFCKQCLLEVSSSSSIFNDFPKPILAIFDLSSFWKSHFVLKLSKLVLRYHCCLNIILHPLFHCPTDLLHLCMYQITVVLFYWLLAQLWSEYMLYLFIIFMRILVKISNLDTNILRGRNEAFLQIL